MLHARHGSCYHQRVLTRRLSVPLILMALLVPAAAAAGQTRSTRTVGVSLSAPAQFNLTLAAVRFTHATGKPSRLALTRAPGLYFVAGVLVRRPVAGGPRALVLAVNQRPRGSQAPDLTRIGVRVTAARKLGVPSLRQVVNALARPVGAGAVPALCGPAAHRPTLSAGDLRSLVSSGRALPGFGADAAVAQAFDVVCGRPYDAAFARAVTGCAAGFAAGCCPPNALCATPPPAPAPAPPPAPTPTPTPVPPACPPCRPPPCTTQVCPLGQTATISYIACPLTGAGAAVCAY